MFSVKYHCSRRARMRPLIIYARKGFPQLLKRLRPQIQVLHQWQPRMQLHCLVIDSSAVSVSCGRRVVCTRRSIIHGLVGVSTVGHGRLGVVSSSGCVVLWLGGVSTVGHGGLSVVAGAVRKGLDIPPLAVAAEESTLLGSSDGDVGLVHLAILAKHGLEGRVPARALLATVVGGDGELHRDREHEEDGGCDGHGEARFHEVAGAVGGRRVADGVWVAEALATDQERILARESAAVVVTAASEDGDGDEATDKAEVEDDCDDSKGTDATEEASEQDPEQGVQSCGAGHALYGTDPGLDIEALADEDGEEVGEDAEDGDCAGELQEAEGETTRAEGESTKCWHGDLRVASREQINETTGGKVCDSDS